MIRFLALLLLFSCSPSPSPADPAQTAVESEPERSPPQDSLPNYLNATYLTGKFDPAEHPDFVKVADAYGDGDPYLLRADTYAAFEAMHAAALEDGVRLILVSATRNFERQKQIWEAKWFGRRLLEGKHKADEVYPNPADRARAILRYSSMPGTSRHHWGTDIDLNALENGYFAAGEGKKIYDWLTSRAAEFGFCQPYTAKGEDRPTGYEEEKWHWSYLPVATQLTDFAATQMRDEELGGFAGAEAGEIIGVRENYVLGINPACKGTSR